MILERGDMWSVFGKTDLFLITTNPIVRKDGGIVMGRGIAKQMKDRFPDFPYKFGTKLAHLVRLQSYDDPLTSVDVDIVGKFGNQLCGFFMVKHHWREPASIDIIKRSVHFLTKLANMSGLNRIDLNFPGIGNGKLKREDVLPIIEQLPDNVHVWEYVE